ncbi:MAG: protein kinase [Thermoanaerobaculia bacterium]|nr:protein kinase [Thermoanaerobaculia bacterium]
MAKILVSDDDTQILQLVKLILESAGHSVLVTSDAGSVPEWTAVHRPDVVVLDVDMPVSGFEILSKLRDDPFSATTPVLFLSGLGGGPDRVRGLSEGADDYLVKPFEPDELVLRVERLATLRSRDDAPWPTNDDVQRFGRYEVLARLGRGAMGTVYRGYDPRLGREVALKTIRLDPTSDEDRRTELLERLRNEAVTIARLSHPNVVAVYDMGDTPDTAYIAMELVDGMSLSDYLKIRGSMPVQDLVPVAREIASGLAQSHARGVAHRDVKPGNVLLGRDGAVKVSDFGLAAVVSSVVEDTTELSGTPGYVPPEVLSQKGYTQRGDCFALGALIYEAVAGEHPLAGKSLRDTILNTLHGRFRPLHEFLKLPDELNRLVTELMSLNPADRPDAESAATSLSELALQQELHWSGESLPVREVESDPPASQMSSGGTG